MKGDKEHKKPELKVSELEIKNNKCTTPVLAEIYSRAEIKVIDRLAECGSKGPLLVHCQLDNSWWGL